MWQCPVCANENTQMLCLCGFDRSLDYEQFPTLSRFGTEYLRSRSAMKALRLEGEKHLLRCEGCGSIAFAYATDKQSFRCLKCGQERLLNSLSDTFQRKRTERIYVRDSFSLEEGRKRISAGHKLTAILNREGIVSISGELMSGNRQAVLQWPDVVAVAAGEEFVAGLLNDGTVMVEGKEWRFSKETVSRWKDITQISVERTHIAGLCKDGRAVSTAYNVNGWNHLIAVEAGPETIVGLQEDGTLVYAGSTQYGQCDFRLWTEIVDISAGHFHTVGLRKDGKVLATGYNMYGQCNVKSWTDIVSVSAGAYHTVGLRRDGTVVVAGIQQKGIEKWTDIVAISAGYDHTIGLCRNGSVVAVGNNKCGQCNANMRQL